VRYVFLIRFKVLAGAKSMPMKFPFYETKAVEALAFIAAVRPGLTPLYISKVLFYAEKWHLNRYGRPIIADTYIAMPKGPVPSSVKNFIDHNWEWLDKPKSFDEAVSIDRSDGLARLRPGTREPDLSLLSQTDMDCLQEAIEFCADLSPDELSQRTHAEQAWLLAGANAPMDYELFIDEDNPHKAEIVAMAQETAAYGVL
jgi:uncharacterized phage-associated protein